MVNALYCLVVDLGSLTVRREALSSPSIKNQLRMTFEAGIPRVEDGRSEVSVREVTDSPMLFDEECQIHELVAGPHCPPV